MGQTVDWPAPIAEGSAMAPACTVEAEVSLQLALVDGSCMHLCTAAAAAAVLSKAYINCSTHTCAVHLLVVWYMVTAMFGC